MATENQRIAARLADQLTEGFIALSVEYRHLLARHREVELQLFKAKQRHLDILERLAPESAVEDHQSFLQDLDDTLETPPNVGVEWLEHLAQDNDQQRRSNAFVIKQAELALDTLQTQVKEGEGVKIWAGPSATRAPEHHHVTGRSRVGSNFTLERDFTTPGTPSRLGCPFIKASALKSEASRRHSLVTPHSSTSKMSPSAVRSKRSSFNDPIRAEICGNDPVQAAPSVEEAAPICPIRFLDQHPPEEIAQYFENHKHEIPRSHEICIKRFQSNSDSVRQLDAKYGNLVSMIQGLGVKHQPMLPEKLEELDEDVIDVHDSNNKVKHWAEGVSESLPEGEALAEEPIVEKTAVDEPREGHFDRPLKEVRVGESPSRPWGITVPSRYIKEGSISEKSGLTASPLDPPEFPKEMLSAKPSGCPFGHGKMLPKPVHDINLPADVTPAELSSSKPPQTEQAPPSEPPKPAATSDTTDTPKSGPQIVFNGPIFFGYAPEQIAIILQQTGLSPKP